MELAHRWRDRSLTKLELVVAILILTILIGSFSRYVLVIFSRAEQSMINSTVININTALHYRAAMAVMLGQYQELELLREINPMEELQASSEINNPKITLDQIPLALLAGTASAPANYGGLINSYTMDSMEKGLWYFNQDNRYLIYLVSNSEFFFSDAEGLPIIRFRIVIDFKDRNSNGKYDPESDEFQTMKLHPVNHYQWRYQAATKY
jgi:hypothetical protein